MNYKILTHNGSYSLSSDFYKYLYPSSSIKKYCYEIELDVGVSKTSKEDHFSTYAGDLKKATTEVNGQLKKQKILEKLDYANQRHSKHLNRAQDRLHWKNKASIPHVHRTPKQLAPIKPSTSMTPQAVRTAGSAMLLGIIAQKARSKLLLKTIKYTLNLVADEVKRKYPNSNSAVLIASIYYLKVNPDYGRAPNLRGIYFDGLIDCSTNILPYNYVDKRVNSLCHNTLKPEFETYKELIDINKLNNKGIYETASLFILCEW